MVITLGNSPGLGCGRVLSPALPLAVTIRPAFTEVNEGNEEMELGAQRGTPETVTIR